MEAAKASAQAQRDRSARFAAITTPPTTEEPATEQAPEAEPEAVTASTKVSVAQLVSHTDTANMTTFTPRPRYSTAETA